MPHRILSGIFKKLYRESRDSYDLNYYRLRNISSREQAAFEEYAKRLTITNVTFTAYTMIFMTLLLLPSDFVIFPQGSPQLTAILVWRGVVIATCIAGLAAFAGHSFLRRYPYAVSTTLFCVSVGASAYLMGVVADDNSALPFGIYTAPLLTVLLIVPLTKRILVTTGLVISFLAALVVANPAFAHSRNFGIMLAWLVGVISVDVAVGHVVYFLLQLNFMHRFLLDRRVQEQTEEYRRAARALISIQEKERERIGRDIHDELGQLLSGLRMEIDRLQIVSGEEQQDNAKIMESAALSQQLLDEVYKSLDLVLNALLPPALQQGDLPAALRNMIQKYGKWHNLACSFSYHGAYPESSEEISLAIYRIIQESLTNIIKHAHARKVSVELHCEPDNLRIVIDDDGRGFDTALTGRHNRFGLLGIRERTQWLNGHVVINSIPGKGTSTTVTIPVPVASGG